MLKNWMSGCQFIIQQSKAIAMQKHPEYLWQFDKLDSNDNITDSDSDKFKVRIRERTSSAGNIMNVEKVVLFKHLSNFWRTFCFEINLILTDEGNLE